MIHFCPNCGFDLNKMIDDTSFNIEAVQNRRSEVVATQNEPKEEKSSILDDYTVTKTKEGVEIAQPELLDNRKRLQILARRPEPIIVPKRMDTELDSFTYKGEKLFFGEGLQQTY